MPEEKKSELPLSLSSIEAFSIDADGCIFNTNYHNSHDVISSNKFLLEHLSKAANNFNSAIFMIGSNRQSHSVDKANSDFNKTESCFTAMKTLITEFSKERKSDTMFNEYLIPDSFENRNEGYTLNNSKEDIYFPFDDSKLLIIYAQTHHIATKYPGQKINFHFYDDRVDGNNGILSLLAKFYRQFPEALPPNMTLHLHGYTGDATPTDYAKIESDPNALLDDKYGKSIAKLAELHYVTHCKYSNCFYPCLNSPMGMMNIAGSQYYEEIYAEFRSYLNTRKIQPVIGSSSTAVLFVKPKPTAKSEGASQNTKSFSFS